MRALVEVTIEKDELNDAGDPVYEKGQYWLHYWGVDYRIIEVEEGRIAAVNYTVAICQNVKTGQIGCFLPSQLRILGRDINIK